MAALKQLNKQYPYTILISCLFFSFSSSNPNPNPNIGEDLVTLLAFKSSADTSDFLSSWSNTSTDPCSTWFGITCHPKTHRVTKLVLENLNLTGSIRILTRLTHLRVLSLHHNYLSASLPNFTSWPNLKHLYLSHNRLSGKFPGGISHLLRLHRLDLSYNEFSFEIPMNELAKLPYLLTLRLEFNSFTGILRVDNSFPYMLLDFNVSNNNLNGKIPDEISTFPASSFVGNADLCGKPLPLKCQAEHAKSAPIETRASKNKGSLKYKMVVMFIVLDVVGVLLALLTITWCCLRKKKKRDEAKINKIQKHYKVYGVGIGRDSLNQEMVCFEGCKGNFVKVDDLLRASAETLGKGCVGTTYKVLMEGGELVVVKRVREKLRKMKEVHGLLEEIGGLRHPNVVSLRAYYSSKDELLLVYDFLHNGSLHNLLHGNRGPGRTPLDWTTRLKFCSGSAFGLTFIHNYNKSNLIHGHITSSNIIIDNQGNACISDIGLHQLLQARSSSNNAYKAPEQMLNLNASENTKKPSKKCDVYSFGVVLLEILTGKMATEESEISLVKWVQGVMNKEWKWDVFDFELSRYKEMEGEMMALLQVAMHCVSSSPRDRPKMSMVHKMIEDIRTNKSASGSAIGFPLDDLSSDSSPSISGRIAGSSN